MVRWSSFLSAACLVLLAWGVAPGEVCAATYGETFERADELEEQGEYAAAARHLEPLLEKYPQDYSLHLELGWLHFQAENYGRAERYYRRAHELSDGAVETTLGLGWTALRRGELEEAEAYFREVRAQDPDNQSAAEGLKAVEEASTEVPVGFDLFAAGTGRFDAANNSSELSWGPVLGLGFREGSWAGGVTYRGIGYDVATRGAAAFRSIAGSTGRSGSGSGGSGGSGGRRTQGSDGNNSDSGDSTDQQSGTTDSQPSGSGGSGNQQRGSSTEETFWQHEFYASLGYGTPTLGVSVHGGRIFSGIENGLDATVAGLVGRFEPFGRLTLEGSYSGYPDEDVWRVAPAWRIPLGERLYVRPSGAFQRAARTESSFLAGSLGAGVEWPRFSLEAGGKFGEEWRPVYLTVPVVYNLNDIVEWGAWATTRIGVTERLRIAATYSYEQFEASGAGPSIGTHFVTTGFVWSIL